MRAKVFSKEMKEAEYYDKHGVLKEIIGEPIEFRNGTSERYPIGQEKEKAEEYLH